MKNSGLNMESVKDHNRALIIQLICTNNGVTRQELTEASHLTPMTLTNITSDLIKNNLICEVDSKNEEKALGRTPKKLYPSPNSPVTAGIFISKTSLHGIITCLLYTSHHSCCTNYCNISFLHLIILLFY